jgi:hypothetical protein
VFYYKDEDLQPKLLQQNINCGSRLLIFNNLKIYCNILVILLRIYSVAIHRISIARGWHVRPLFTCRISFVLNQICSTLTKFIEKNNKIYNTKFVSFNPP